MACINSYDGIDSHTAYVEAMTDKLAIPLGFCYCVTLIIIFGFTAICRVCNQAERQAYAAMKSNEKIAEIECAEDDDSPA